MSARTTFEPCEAYYETLPVTKIGPQRLLGLPLLLQPAGNDSKRVWIAVTEANLTDYAGMYLSGGDGKQPTLIAKLSPLPGRKDGAKVRGKAPHASPWRVLMIADDPGRLIESHIVFHLSDQPAIKDTSWIKPDKTTFPWGWISSSRCRRHGTRRGCCMPRSAAASSSPVEKATPGILAG